MREVLGGIVVFSEEGREYWPSTSRPVGEKELRGGVGGLVLVS